MQSVEFGAVQRFLNLLDLGILSLCKNAPTLATVAVGTDENEPSKVSSFIPSDFPPKQVGHGLYINFNICVPPDDPVLTPELLCVRNKKIFSIWCTVLRGRTRSLSDIASSLTTNLAELEYYHSRPAESAASKE